MPALYGYSNVQDTALRIVESKGFRMWRDEDRATWYAEKDGWDFTAHSPLELLGVISIFEHHAPKEFSEYWWRIGDPSAPMDVPTVAPEFTPVWRKDQ